jgi:cytochrome d ubiquinol oxidase subunit I
MVTAAYLATALMVGGSAAWHLLRGHATEAVRVMLSMALWMLLATAPLQALIGDAHGLNTLEHQPAKLAAIEGHWENHPGDGVPLILFGWPDMEAETTRYKIEIPRAGSLLLTHSWDGQILALKDFAPADRPNSTVVFWTFRVMVGLGFLMIALALWGLALRRGGRIYRSRPFLRFALLMGPSGLIAILAGWMTTEIGRQPWIIQGLMRTAEGVSAHSAAQLGISLALFVLVYFAVFGAGTAYLLRLIAKGPEIDEAGQPMVGGPGRPRHPGRPLSAAPESGDRNRDLAPASGA